MIWSMLTYNAVIAGLWLVLIVYWLVSAAGTKRSVSRPWAWQREIGLRLGILALVLLALRLSALYHTPLELRSYPINRNVPMGVLGVMLCALGVGLAIWARTYLGRNWGMPMSQKESPALVTTGPYAYIRHPVYAGFLLAMLGSAIGESLIWLIPLIVFGVYFSYSARREEKLLLAQFPDQYSLYMKRTKMILPFIW
jgi:protein-S-isoprenylcysteine O-methyltransferase Ste14